MFTNYRRKVLLAGFLLTPIIGCTEPGQPTPQDAATGTSTSPDLLSTTPDTPTTAREDTNTSSGDWSSMTTGTSGDPESGSDATVGGPECGDGVVNAGEACDDGLAGNGDTRFCKSDCTLNVCGDGELFVGWELCDDGVGNSDEYGNLCNLDCEPGARCGDHKLQAEFETCDLGLENGGLKGDDQGILCDASCNAQRRRGFITKGGFSGALGGLFGADLKCRAAAKAAGLAEPERFHAYLSTGEIDAGDRFQGDVVSMPYVLVTGAKFADSFAALVEEGPLGDGIVVAEDGSTLHEKFVATNTAPGGLRFSPDQDCQGWTSAELMDLGRVGLNGVPMNSPDAAAWKAEQWWTGFGGRPCKAAILHLYCLEI